MNIIFTITVMITFTPIIMILALTDGGVKEIVDHFYYFLYEHHIHTIAIMA